MQSQWLILYPVVNYSFKLKTKKNKTKTKLKTVRDNIASTVDVSTGKKCTGKYGPEKLWIRAFEGNALYCHFLNFNKGMHTT